MEYYKIIPLLRLPLKKSPFFTYRSAESLKTGSFVKIIFGKKQVRGVVFGKTIRPRGFKAREISKIIGSDTLAKNQLRLAFSVSEKYFYPVSLALKLFPFSLIKKKEKSDQKTKTCLKKNKITMTQKQKEATALILNGKEKEVLLFGPAASGNTEVLMAAAEKYLKEKKQALILVPDIFLLYQEAKRYALRFGNESVAVFHSGLKKSEMATSLESIKTGRAKIIVASRMGVFLPFSKLGMIAIDEEQDVSHKQWDQSPRYSSKEIAKELGKIFGAKIIYCSATPSAETFFEACEKNIGFVELPMLKTKKFTVKKPQLELIDLRESYFKKRKGLFSNRLLELIGKTLENKKMSIVLVPRRGKSKVVICDSCEKIMLCKNCDLPLLNIGDKLKCLHCSYEISSFSKCPHCKSFNLKNIGFGTEKIARDLEIFFPKAKIAVADRESFAKEKNRGDIAEKISRGQAQILVGTTTAIKGLDLESFSLAVVINDKGWAGKNELRHNEKILGAFFQLAGRLNRPGSDQKGIVVIQTFEPQNKLFEYLERWDWKKYLKEELGKRKKLLLPPFSHLIKITVKDISLESVEKNSQLVYNKLLETQDSKIIETLAPYFGSIKKTRNIWQKNVLLKASDLNSKKIQNVLCGISDKHSLDIDPENIF
jgi:primosomal protein N' (replication factor Y) (superfamily II helicase)